MPDFFSAADFNLKLDHQNRAMSERLVELGYNLIIDTCPAPKGTFEANSAMMGASAANQEVRRGAQYKLLAPSKSTAMPSALCVRMTLERVTLCLPASSVACHVPRASQVS